ncbi:MAG: mevalonate kinase [Thermoproteota archaeon]|nr:mevalonate kinase [Thermoproteota archaeon]
MNEYSTVQVHSSAPGKIILLGEHFVVYGNPVILAAINRRISLYLKPNGTPFTHIKSGGMELVVSTSKRQLLRRMIDSSSFLYPVLSCIANIQYQMNNFSGLDVIIESQIPHGEGLGSSAASCVATVGAMRALFGKIDKPSICKNAATAERIIHKNSSGADCYVSTFGGLMYYDPTCAYTHIDTKIKFLFLVCTTGIKHDTGNLVSRVKKFRDKNRPVFVELSERAKVICNDAKKALASGDPETLGKMMTENHKLLTRLDVSHPKLEEFIEICMSNGALGSKLTGAGGGGSIIALIPKKKLTR